MNDGTPEWHWGAERFAAARVARLATVRPDGAPHVVPFTFAVAGSQIFWAVDHKPKRTSRLQRLANIAAEPRVSAIADEYGDDWSRLWWVRADGAARIADGGEAARGFEALAAKYVQYREAPPQGPVVVIDVERWSGWQAAEPG